MSDSLWLLPGSSVHGVSQARILEWVAIAFSATSVGLQEKQGNSRKTSASLTVLKPLTVWITRNYESHSVVSDSLQPHGLYSPWNSPSQNTGVGSLSLFLGIFPTQGSNPGLPHCRWILYQLSHQGSPRVLAWVAYPFSSGSSQPKNRTRVSCIAGEFFTNWAMTEATAKLPELLSPVTFNILFEPLK